LRDQRETESSSFSSIVLVLDYDYEDDDEDDTNKNAFNSAKRRMKASNGSCRKRFDRLASSFSLTEKSAAHNERPRRAQPNRYPDSGLKPHSAFPFRTAEQWLGEFVAVTVAQPSRIFTGFPDI
jgi:hypothetical protein